MLKRNPEQTAWLILWSAFFTFWMIFCTIVFTAGWYLFYDTEPFQTDVTSVRGIVLVNDPTTDLPISVIDGHSFMIREGFTIHTDNTSQAILTFNDDSSVTMYGNTTLVVEESQESRFSFGFSPTRIAIALQTGRIRATIARKREMLQVDGTTPQATIAFGQGSFSAEVNEEQTQITARLGEATIIANDEPVILPQNSRVVINAEGQPSEPLPAAQNLLGESTFESNIFTETWELYTDNFTEGAVQTKIEVVPQGVQGQPVVELRSFGQDNTHTEIGVVQQVDRDVRDFRSLRVSAEVQLVYQSLEGGGYQGTEFPMMLNIAYKDAEGNDRNWFHGFYYLSPPENYRLNNQAGHSNEQIARIVWYPFESPNLLTTLGREKPVYIKSIRIYASGWVYNSRIANISLLAEE